MPPEDLAAIAGVAVSPDVRQKLEWYRNLLVKWQKAINLVSPATLPEAWERHFLDSAQLAACLPTEDGTLFDLGSGAGFPGLVLAMLRPGLRVHLIESDGRKAEFLRTVSRETQTPVQIINQRIESVSCETTPDIVTARALAGLPELLAYASDWVEANPALMLLFLKGARTPQEIKAARDIYDFTLEVFPSCTHAAARILRITHLRQR